MVFDLPLHPLVVHAPVVLIPLTTLGVIVLALQKRRGPELAYALLGLIVAAALATGAAVLSGNALADLLGFEPETHERWGLLLAGTNVVYLLVAGPWLWKVAHEGERHGSTSRPWGLAAAAVAIAASALTVLAGHSGAEMAWSDVSALPQTGSSTSTPAAGASADATEPGTTSGQASSYTMEDVAQHASAESCWTAVNGNVYDLTDWISQHPGGSSAITRLCGTDGTDAFEDEHNGDSEPAAALKDHLLGPLG